MVVQAGFFKGLGFFIFWLLADWVWGKATSMLLGIVSGSMSDYGQYKAAVYGEAPFRVTFVMFVDVLGHLFVPWLVGGYYLGWF